MFRFDDEAWSLFVIIDSNYSHSVFLITSIPSVTGSQIYRPKTWLNSSLHPGSCFTELEYLE